MKAKVLALGSICLILSLSFLCLQYVCLQLFAEKERLSKVEHKIKAIPSDKSFDNEPLAKYISIPVVEDDGSTYRIWMCLLFEPISFDQVQAWTDIICKSSKRILNDNGVVRDIEVRAIRIIGFSWEEGWVLFYGKTFYDHCTDKFEFKKTEELNYKEKKGK